MTTEQHATFLSTSTILLVDDEIGLRSVLQDFLVMDGYNVITASDGMEALAIVRERPIDILVSDMDMPNLDGLGALKIMREEKIAPLTIFMTGFGTVEMAVEAMKHGAWDFLIKPFKIDQLAAVIDRARQHLEVKNSAISLHAANQIHESSTRLSEPNLDTEDYLRIAGESINRAIDADATKIWRSSQFNRANWQSAVTWGDEKLLQCLPQDFYNSADKVQLARVLRPGEPVFVDAASLRELEISNVPDNVHGLLVPFHDREGRYAVGLFLRQREPFTEGQRRTTHIIASRAASAITSHYLIGGVQSSVMETITALVNALEAKDPYTQGHSFRVSEWSTLLARQLELPASDIRNIRAGGLLHDIGKIGLDMATINKRERLTPEEFELVKLHPVIGKNILAPIRFLRPVLPMVLHHHERFDGGGYPYGLATDQIPLGARIIAVADAWEVMITDRPYRPALRLAVARSELERHSGSQFDPQVAEAMLELTANFELFSDLPVQGGRAGEAQVDLQQSYELDVRGLSEETIF